MKLHHLDWILNTDILSQAQFHDAMANISDTPGITSYSNGEIVFFAPHAREGNWVTKIDDIGFVSCIYRRHPGIDGSINTPQKLCDTFYHGQYAVYDIDILKDILREIIEKQEKHA